MEVTVHNALHVLEHSFVETIYLVPFLFLAYLAMEWLEHKTGERTQKAITRAGTAGPVVGSVLGVVPQCGFSAVAATLYAGRVITLRNSSSRFFFQLLMKCFRSFLPKQFLRKPSFRSWGRSSIIGHDHGLHRRSGPATSSSRQARFTNPCNWCEQDNCGCNDDCATCEQAPERAYEHHDADVEHTHVHGSGWKRNPEERHQAHVTGDGLHLLDRPCFLMRSSKE